MSSLPSVRVTFLLRALLIVGLLSAALNLLEASQDLRSTFSEGPTTVYGDFQSGTVQVEGGKLHIRADAGKGGVAFRESLNLSGQADSTPTLRLTLGDGHKARLMRTFFEDANGKRSSFAFNLRKTPKGQSVEVSADKFAPVHDPAVDPGFDPSKIVMWQIQGGWNAEPVDIFVEAVRLVPPTPEVLVTRKAEADRRAQEAAKAEAERVAREARVEVMLRDGVERSPNGASVQSVCAVAPDCLMVRLNDRTVETGLREPYVAQPDDDLRPAKGEVPAWTPEGLRLVPKSSNLHRKVDGTTRDLGVVYQPFPDFKPHLWTERVVGDPLGLETVDSPRAYRITSADDPAYAKPVEPLAVHRKTKPNNGNDLTGEKTLAHTLSLKLPHPLREGATYEITFSALNTKEATATYRHDSRKNLSDAIHVNQIGYRPDDPFKRAYFSFWTGTGGGIAYAPESFEILDAATGKTVHQGKVAGTFPASRAEGFRTKRNFVGADVHSFDFHDFNTPGTYRIHVPGIGVSETFSISPESTWAEAFRTSMHGLLSHRSGLRLGPPFTTYERPRPMHPADGFKVFQIPYTTMEGEAGIVEQAIREKLDSGVPVEKWETLPDGWGGYMDAGDWDRRSVHLIVSRHLAELFSTNPAFFEKFSLALPEDEAKDGIPDLLNEVMWNVAFYRRLQSADGGVRGGIESTEHPRPGEASWEESLALAVFAPDPLTSYSHAGASALLARLLAPYDANESRAFAESARKAYAWAEANSDRVLAEAEKRTAALPKGLDRTFDRKKTENSIREQKLVAAGELFALTREPAFHETFKALVPSAGGEPDELGAIFRYAMLPESETDPATRALAMQRIVASADLALKFGADNAFGLHSQAPFIPLMGYTGFYSVPEMVCGPVLPRAYLLTKDKRYLQGALQAAHYSAGANPLNMTFTTGVGHRYPQNPLHIDSRVTGQPAPKGITIYGPMDATEDFGFNNWVHTYHLQQMLPNSRTWPASEWHVDLFRWPAMSEYTVSQSFRPTAYYWGFLASRPAQP